MGRKNFLNLLVIGSLASTYQTSFGAELDPVGKRIDNAQVMNRVALVGVIAGGSATSGVAVIKDNQTGRTYAIKTGDNLPGVGHIKLQGVQRELAIFDVAGKEYQVRLSVGGYAQEAEDDEDLDADIASEYDGPGLFEKWHGVGVAVDDHNDSESLSATNERQDLLNESRKNDDGNNRMGSRNHSTVVVDLDNTAKSDAAVKLRKDQDGPVNAFLDHLTVGAVSEGNLRKKIEAANANKKKIEASNVKNSVDTPEVE